jgi:hypothetical protein
MAGMSALGGRGFLALLSPEEAVPDVDFLVAMVPASFVFPFAVVSVSLGQLRKMLGQLRKMLG